MKPIKIYLDHRFPYEKIKLSNAQTTVKKVSLPKLPFSKHFHIIDLFFKSFRSDIILGNRRSVLMLGLLYYIYKPKRLSLIGYEIIFNFKDSFKHKLVKLAWRLAVRNIDKLVVMSRSECKYLTEMFETELGKFSTISFFAENAEYIGPAKEGYVFAAGRMERDFVSLVTALKDSPYPAIIVADKSQQQKLDALKSENIQILYNIDKEQYLSLLRKSRMVAVPLHEGAASRGQVVMLEAMKYGKPIVCTRVAGTVDYLEDGKDGFYVAPNSPESFRKIFDTYFNDFNTLEKIGKQAYQTQQAKYSPEIFYKNYLDLITQEYKSKNKMHLYVESERSWDQEYPSADIEMTNIKSKGA